MITQSNRQTILHNNDIPDVTIRETNSTTRTNGVLSQRNKQTVLHNNDIPEWNQRNIRTNEEPIHTGPSTFTRKRADYVDPETHRDTTKESVLLNTIQGHVSYNNQQIRTINEKDTPKHTQKESLVQSSIESGVVSGVVPTGHIVDKNHLPKHTIRETTTGQNNISTPFQSNGIYTYREDDIPDPTQRQVHSVNTTINEGGIRSQHQKQTIVEKDNIQYNGCRDDTFHRTNERPPTVVSLFHIPHRHTSGTVKLKNDTDTIMDRSVYPSTTIIGEDRNRPITFGNILTSQPNREQNTEYQNIRLSGRNQT